MAGTLILCATPIGNLADAPPRLTEALRAADVIYAEDTRRTAVLLRHLGVDAASRSYFAGNEEDRAEELGRHLKAGSTVALVTDAGVPAISDPGVSAVRAAEAAGATVTTVPGPSAVTAALAVAGLGGDRFVFEGFLPRKGAERSRRIERLAEDDRPIVLFSSPKRVHADLVDLASQLGDDRQVVVCREMTKLHEEVWRGTLAEGTTYWGSLQPRGEFTIVVAAGRRPTASMDAAVIAVDAELESGESLSAAVRTVSEGLGVPRRALYERMIKRSADS